MSLDGNVCQLVLQFEIKILFSIYDIIYLKTEKIWHDYSKKVCVTCHQTVPGRLCGRPIVNFKMPETNPLLD